MTYASILEAAMHLSAEERSQLAQTLWETVPDEEGNDTSPTLSNAWRDEIALRSAAYKRGELATIPWEQVRDSVQRKYAAHG